MNKKGFAYILIVSLLLVVVITIFLTSNKFKYQDRTESQHIRIKSTNDFVKNLNTDIHRSSYIASYRALISLENSITSSGIFLEDIQESFRETFFYGTIAGEPANLMSNSSFELYIQKVNALGSQKGLIIDINVTNINLSHSDPWVLDVVVNASVNISDRDRLASWTYIKEYKTKVPIIDLRDPLYGVYTENKIPNTIRYLNYSNLVNSGDPNTLIKHLNESYYLPSIYAPTYIMRFENNSNPDPNGIESVVNIQTLSDQGLEVYSNRVKIDYIYFTDSASDKICAVENIPSDLNFVANSDRISLYELDELNYSISCP